MVKNEGCHSEKIKTNRRSAGKENGRGQYSLPNKMLCRSFADCMAFFVPEMFWLKNWKRQPFFTKCVKDGW